MQFQQQILFADSPKSEIQKISNPLQEPLLCLYKVCHHMHLLLDSKVTYGNTL
jgi:hypothetical protein